MAKATKTSGTKKSSTKKSDKKKKSRRRSPPKKPSDKKSKDKKPDEQKPGDQEKSPAGRRTILTPELLTNLITVISAGNYYVTACNYVGIAESTFYSWLKRGEEELFRLLDEEKETNECPEPKESELIYLEFMEAIKKADGQAEVKAVLKVQSAFGKDWKAAMTYLERRYSERWRRKDTRELTGEGGGALQVIAYIPDNGRPDDDKQVPDGQAGGKKEPNGDQTVTKQSDKKPSN